MIAELRSHVYRGGSGWLSAGLLGLYIGVSAPSAAHSLAPAARTLKPYAMDRTLTPAEMDRTLKPYAMDRTLIPGKVPSCPE